MKKVLLCVSAFILAWNAHAEKQAAKVPTPTVVATVVSETDDDPIDESYGGNASDQDNFGVDPAEEIDPTDEGDDGPDTEFGGEGEDPGFVVDPPEEIDPSGEGDDGPDTEFGGHGEDPGFDVTPPDSMGVDDAEIVFNTSGETISDELYGGDEFCAFVGNKVDVEVYDNNKLIIKGWSGVQGYDLVVDFEEASFIGGFSEEGNLPIGLYEVTKIVPFVDGREVGTPDISFGGNDSDDPGFNVDPGVIDPSGEGDDQPDSEFGGFGGDEGFDAGDNKDGDFGGFGGDPGFDVNPGVDQPVESDEPDSDFGGFGGDDFGVDPADEIDPSGEGDGGPDSDFGGFGGDDDFGVDPSDVIDPSGEGDDQPDSDFGGFGGDEGFDFNPGDEQPAEGGDDADSDFGGFGGDEGFDVDPADEIDPSGEGDDERDTDFGGFDDDPGFNVDPADEIDTSGEGDDGPDTDFGGHGEDPGFNVDPDFPAWVATPTGDSTYPEVHFYAEGSSINVISDTEGLIMLYINCPDAEGAYDEDSLPRWYMVKYTRDTSSITDVMVIEMERDVIYNMAGQRVGANYRGFAIKNGKKILIK